MIKGITEEQEQIIKKILSKYPYDFFYYGSRVKGDYTKSSDLDIMLKSQTSVDDSIINELKIAFNKSLLPFIVNISDYSSMDEYFYNIIKNDLVKV